MNNSRTIQGIIVLIVGLILAVWAGLSIVTNQAQTIMQVTVAGVIITCLALGRRIWLLIPFTAAVSISLSIPGQPSSLLLGQALTLGFCGLLFLMRKLPFQLAMTELEFWVLVLTLFIMQVYMRNPVGINLFRGDTVGGKGYALYAIALFSCLLLSGLRVPDRDLKWILRVSIFGGLLNTVISVAGYYIYTIAYYTGGSAAATTTPGVEEGFVEVGAATRVGFLVGLSNNLALWISSYISPLRACVKPLWAVLILVACVGAGLSGFRNAIVTVGLTFFIGTLYRSGLFGFIFSTFGAIAGIALLAVVNTLHPLPPNLQRSLTFLPGTWEERHKLDAAGSTEWRFEIWREVLLTDRWIHNKWLGDGLGFTATELAAQKTDRKGARAGISGFEAHREAILANGDYHSGPVSTIRVIGYIGLLFFLIAQYRLAIHGHRQILRARDTEWLPLALFVGIPMITSPLIFVFLFGDFKSAASAFLLALGMCRLLENNLPLPAYVKPRWTPYVLQRGNQPNGRDRSLINMPSS